MSSFARVINRRFAEELQFLKGWRRDRDRVGAILPTSQHAARRMASVIDVSSGLPVLELGPGTGSITRAILAAGVYTANLVSVEYSSAFCETLMVRFPGVRVIEGDAFNLNAALGELRNTQFDCVISALPLLNFPMSQRVNLLRDLLSRIPLGRPVIQISYGPMSPVANFPEEYMTTHYDVIFRNIPPAQLWTYHQPI